MIEIPWQLFACLVLYLCVDRIVRHIRQSDCEQRIRQAVVEAKRDQKEIERAYHNAYLKGFDEGRSRSETDPS